MLFWCSVMIIGGDYDFELVDVEDFIVLILFLECGYCLDYCDVGCLVWLDM